jgi:[CysO sulfur-carrier protein]-S-L-cysteine hydrolase
VNLIISSGIFDEVIRHAKSAYPREACGLIAGIKPSMVGNRLIPMINIAQSACEFEMDPAELIRTLRDLRGAGEELAAIYHSHPHGPARPSTMDVQRAHYPEAAHLIVSLADPDSPQVAGFRIVDGEVLEIEVHAIV